MQKTKNIRLLISLVIMTLCLVILFFLNDSKNNPSVDKTLFSIAHLDKIDRVLLQSSKENIELKFDGVKWMVNQTQEADAQMITVLFATLKQVEAKRKIASSIKDSLQKEITTNGIKISCFAGASLEKEFWCEGNSQKMETYFQLPNETPYLVAIPGYRVHVASIFELPSIDWRDKRVFNFNWQNIKSLEVVFPGNEKQNFKASFQNNLFSIEGIETDTTKLDKYMDALFQLRADRILTTEQAKSFDSLASQKPILKITIQDIGKRDYTFTLFPITKKKELIGKVSDDLVSINPFILKDVIHPKSYFVFKKSE
jgi:hypothetical protein